MMDKYNDYKIHIAKKGDSTQSICAQYSVSENDLVKANPGINLAPFGGGFFSAPKFRLDIKQGDHVRIPFHNKDKDKKGVKTIRGKKSVKVGVWENYEVTEWYEGTPKEERNPSKVKWDLYLMKNGAKPELVLQKEEGKIRFQEKAIGNKYKVVGYLHEPELNSGSAVLVNVEASEKREILSIKISDINNQQIKEAIAYGQTINVHVETTGMKGEYIHISLWEDDANGQGHSDSNKHNLVSEGKVLVGNKGVAHKQFVLKADFKKIANAYLSKGDSSEGSTHEYYVTAYASGESKASPNINVRNPDYQEKRKEETHEHLEGNKQEPKNEPTQPSNTQIASETVKAKADATTIEVAESTTVAKVGDTQTTIIGIESLVDAYFAKEEFKKETSETAGQHTYTFQKANKNVDQKKDEIAGIIKKRVDEKVKSEKKYAKLDDIKNALTQKDYAKGASITFNLYKLGPEYVKVNNAPLEEEVYVVAKTVNLDGKEVIIKIKEKEEILVAKDADLKVLEAKENGNEITELKAKVEKGIAKVKIKLRPKSDEDLKTWKEKLKGIKDGTHTYTFGGDGNNTANEEQKKKIAGIILKKVNESLSSQKKFAKVEDIVSVLTKTIYNKGEQITFDLYKEVTEYLWLKAECTGEVKKHEGEFLKRDGAYFMIGKKCFCNRDITLTEFETILKKLRQSESMSNTSSLFYADNCKLDDKTNQGFITELNKAFNKYEINSCIRKIHFLAQVYHETDRLQTTEEYEGKDSYKPYIGRGLMQLTWESNYAIYKAYSGLDCVVNYEIIATDLKNAIDSAGWYWKQGKVLGVGTKWTGPSDAPQYVKVHNPNYPKTTIEYTVDGETKKYGTVNLNLIADDDKVDIVSYLVNGGSNGLQERRNYLSKLKEIFNYPEGCAKSGKTSGSNGKVNIHFDGETAQPSGISQRTRTVLEEVGEASKNYDIYITSTARTPADQARIMFDNTERTGAAVQKGIYANAGDQVIDVYTAGKNARKTEAQIIQDMEDKINELGPSTVSKHLADPAVMNTFDVSIRRLTNPNDFKTEMQKRTELHKLLNENGAYHIEINQ